MKQVKSTGNTGFKVEWSGDIKFDSKEEMDMFLSDPKRVEGWDMTPNFEGLTIALAAKPNLVVNSGVQRSLDRLFAINGTPAALTRIGIDTGTNNPVAASASSAAGGGSDTGSTTRTLRTFNATPTRSVNVVSSLGTFNDVTTGGIGAVGFIMKRLFLSAHASNITNTTTADTVGTLYSMTNVFTIDFTSISTWSIVFNATVTGAGTQSMSSIKLNVGTSATSAALTNTGLTGGVFKAFDATPIRTGLTVASIAPIGPFNKTSAVSIVVTVSLTQV